MTSYYIELNFNKTFSGLSKGAPDHLLPVHKEEYLQSGYFNYVGRAISLSVVQGGIGFVGMSRALAQYLVSGDITAALPELTMADVPDFNVQICLREVHSMQFTK